MRSLEDIAMDLPEQGGAKITKLGDSGVKNNLITASNGSLVSTGDCIIPLHFYSFLLKC